MICGACGKQHDPCGVTDNGKPMCWPCYNARLDRILAQLSEKSGREAWDSLSDFERAAISAMPAKEIFCLGWGDAMAFASPHEPSSGKRPTPGTVEYDEETELMQEAADAMRNHPMVSPNTKVTHE